MKLLPGRVVPHSPHPSFMSSIRYSLRAAQSPILSPGYVHGVGERFWLGTPWFLAVEHLDSTADWASPKEMDAGLFQGLLVASTMLL